MIHPMLWPAILGACVAVPALAVAAVRLAQSWRKLSKRRRWALFAGLAIAELVVWLNVYAWLIEPNTLVVRRVDIESASWHGAPITIAALSDLHVAGPHMRARRVERIVRRVNALRPDIVVLLGDYIAGHADPIDRAPSENSEMANGLAYLAALDAPLGVIAVLGNHDSWYDRAAVTTMLQAAGVATLWNRNVVVRRGDEAFIIAGLEDKTTGDPSFAAALDGAPDGLDVIALSHSPDPFTEPSPMPLALMLAGHTHCGQVRLPLIGALATASQYGQRYVCGYVSENGRALYTSAGLGTSFLPVRFLAPPEIVLITLRAPGDHRAPPAPEPESGGDASG